MNCEYSTSEFERLNAAADDDGRQLGARLEAARACRDLVNREDWGGEIILADGTRIDAFEERVERLEFEMEKSYLGAVRERQRIAEQAAYKARAPQRKGGLTRRTEFDALAVHGHEALDGKVHPQQFNGPGFELWFQGIDLLELRGERLSEIQKFRSERSPKSPWRHSPDRRTLHRLSARHRNWLRRLSDEGMLKMYDPRAALDDDPNWQAFIARRDRLRDWLRNIGARIGGETIA